METGNPKLETGTFLGDRRYRKFFRLKAACQTVWNFFRDLSGENDYARYRAWTLARGQSPMAPKDFYLAQLRQKYSRPNRCC